MRVVLNRPLRRAVFADVVRLQRCSWHRCRRRHRRRRRHSKPVLHAYAPKQLQKLGSSLGREINRNLLQNVHPHEKREEQRDLIFRLVHRVVSSACIVEFEYDLDFRARRSAYFIIRVNELFAKVGFRNTVLYTS